MPKKTPAGPNQIFPSGASQERSIRDLFDRVNFLIAKMTVVEEKLNKIGDDDLLLKAVQGQGVAIQAATDSLTALSTFVGFGSAQPISATPTIAGGAPGQVVYINSAGSLAGDSGLTYSDSTDILSVGGAVRIANAGSPGAATDVAGFYAQDVVAGATSGFVVGESGTIKRLNDTIVYLTANTTRSSTITPTATALSLNLQAGIRYRIRVVGHYNEGGGGVRFTLGGGTVTATSVMGSWRIANDNATTTTGLQQQFTSLTTQAALAGGGGDNGLMICDATVLVNAAGTIVVSFAQQASVGAVSTLFAGSYIQLIQS